MYGNEKMDTYDTMQAEKRRARATDLLEEIHGSLCAMEELSSVILDKVDGGIPTPVQAMGKDCLVTNAPCNVLMKLQNLLDRSRDVVKRLDKINDLI